MITGVVAVLLAWAALAASGALLAWGLLAALINIVYIPLLEEPGLARRFGADYEAYRRNVPRWLPRRAPWEP
jgi:protein-S-isoprenylcysteine O-methyltransferase Ste14